jgi:hypothetical protein
MVGLAKIVAQAAQGWIVAATRLGQATLLMPSSRGLAPLARYFGQIGGVLAKMRQRQVYSRHWNKYETIDLKTDGFND